MRVLTKQQFVVKSKAFHGSRYDYSKSKYVNRRTKIAIRCKIHSFFYQRPDDHMSGCGCPKCSEVHSTSQYEQAWLDSKRIAERNRNKRLMVRGRTFNVDAYIPKSRTVYEFYGDIWHGNPDRYSAKQTNPVNGIAYGELHTKTVARERLLKRAGYKVVSVWESDWKDSQ